MSVQTIYGKLMGICTGLLLFPGLTKLWWCAMLESHPGRRAEADLLLVMDAILDEFEVPP